MIKLNNFVEVFSLFSNTAIWQVEGQKFKLIDINHLSFLGNFQRKEWNLYSYFPKRKRCLQDNVDIYLI